MILRLRAGDSFEHGAWSLGRHYRWINWIAIALGRVHLARLHAPDRAGGHAVADGFDWNLVNYAPLTILGAFLLFGGWWVLSAKNWFMGPVRMGTEIELEQLEARQEGAFLLPADTEFESA